MANSKATRLMLEVWGDRMSARQAAWATADAADGYATECENAGNDSGAAYWNGKRDIALAICRELDMVSVARRHLAHG